MDNFIPTMKKYSRQILPINAQADFQTGTRISDRNEVINQSTTTIIGPSHTLALPPTLLNELRRTSIDALEIVLNKRLASSEVIRKTLSDTGDRQLFAAGTDINLATGFAEDNPEIYFPDKWTGKNLLGEGWMNVRAQLGRPRPPIVDEPALVVPAGYEKPVIKGPEISTETDDLEKIKVPEIIGRLREKYLDKDGRPLKKIKGFKRDFADLYGRIIKNQSDSDAYKEFLDHIIKGSLPEREAIK